MEGNDTFRDMTLNRDLKREHSRVGRLMAHVKHIEMRNQIHKMREQEGKLPEDAKATADEVSRAKDILKSEKTPALPTVSIDEDLNLPYDFGYDKVIKEKKDKVNEKKFRVNQLMDELVEKLGYVDYRDMLAANRYILEAMSHEDYHQRARAKTLALALSKMNRLKREQLQARAKEAAGEEGDVEQTKLELLMDEDPAVKTVFDEVYKDTKTDAEHEYEKLRKLHEKFDMVKDERKMADKLMSRWFNVEKIQTGPDVVFSEEFTDPEDNLFYRRYKTEHAENVVSYEDHVANLDRLEALRAKGERVPASDHK